MPTPIQIDRLPLWTTKAASGDVIHIRRVGESDASHIQQYFRALSGSSRYRRFMGSVNELSPDETARFVGSGPVPTFAVAAEIRSDNEPLIVGEASCALDIERKSGDLGVSVADRWQRRGVGSTLVHVVECCAIRLGLRQLLGEALQSNDEIKSLARRAGFAITRRPGEWQVIRFEKQLPSSDQQWG
jgi:GNAT superfamily N-acetyltransferase